MSQDDLNESFSTPWAYVSYKRTSVDQSKEKSSFFSSYFCCCSANSGNKSDSEYVFKLPSWDPPVTISQSLLCVEPPQGLKDAVYFN